MKTTTMEKKVSKEKVKREIPEAQQNMAICVAIEKAEALLVTKEVQGEIIDKLAYSFKQGDRDITGLTFWGYRACAEQARVHPWKPQFLKPEYSPLGNGKMILTVGVKNPKTKAIEYGNCVFDPNTRFAERTALTNAKRYALDKHIAIPQRVAFIEYLMTYEPEKVMLIENKAVKSVKAKELTTSTSTTPQDAQKETAVKAIFAQIATINKKHNINLDKEKVKEFVKKEAKVEHIKDMTIEQMREAWEWLYELGKDEISLKSFVKEMSV